jgi:DNA polymerase-1
MFKQAIIDQSSLAFVLVTTDELLNSVTLACSLARTIAVDCETTGLQPFHGSRMRILSVCTDQGDVFVIDCFQVDPYPFLSSLKRKTLVAHNFAFDGPFLALHGLDYAANSLRCTYISSFLLSCGYKSSNKLVDVLMEQLSVAISKDLQVSNWGSPVLTMDQYAYAANDTRHLIRLHHHLYGKIREERMRKVWHLEMVVLKAVLWMRMNGVSVDRNQWITLYNRAIARRTRLAKELKDMVPPRTYGAAYSWRKPTDIKQAAGRLGIPLESTNKASLALLGDYPFISKVQEWRKCDQIIKTFGPDWLGFIGRDGMVHADFVQCRPETGRFSCNNPNMQQIPRGPHRKCFVAAAGWSIVKADYSTIELRMAAKIAREPSMKAAFLAKEDLHTKTARDALGVANPTKEDRTLAKALNFGLLYGCGANTLRTQLAANWNMVLPLEKVQQLKTKFFKAYKGLKKWHNKVKRKRPTTIRTPWGRMRYNLIDTQVQDKKTKQWKKKEPFTQRVNTPVQATSADGMKQAIADLWSQRNKYPVKLLLVVHDEIVLTCPDYCAEDVAKWLQCIMTNAMQPLLGDIPCEVETTIGKSWGG